MADTVTMVENWKSDFHECTLDAKLKVTERRKGHRIPYLVEIIKMSKSGWMTVWIKRPGNIRSRAVFSPIGRKRGDDYRDAVLTKWRPSDTEESILEEQAKGLAAYEAHVKADEEARQKKANDRAQEIQAFWEETGKEAWGKAPILNIPDATGNPMAFRMLRFVHRGEQRVMIIYCEENTSGYKFRFRACGFDHYVMGGERHVSSFATSSCSGETLEECVWQIMN